MHDQALNDGYINELTNVLKNLVVLPSSAETAWYNVSKIVNAACKPVQAELLQKQMAEQGRKRMATKMAYQSVVGGKIDTNAFDENYAASKSDAAYPNYSELHRLLEIRNAEDAENVHSDKVARKQGLQVELERAREKHLALEEGLLAEKDKNLELATQIQHFLPATVGKKNELDKYRKMIKFNMPKASIMNRMRQDGVGKAIIGQYEEQETLPGGNTLAAAPAQTQPKPAPVEPKDDDMAKYSKMLKLKMPAASVVNRMRQDGIDKAIIAHFQEHGEFSVVNATATSASPSAEDEAKSTASVRKKMLQRIPLNCFSVHDMCNAIQSWVIPLEV